MAIETIQGIADLARIDRGTVDLLFREALRATRREILARIETSSLGVPVLIANP